jgi:hypothetical protein
MAVITILEFTAVTQELYQQVGATLAASAGGPPTGILYHACGPIPGGWRIVDIWDTQAAFDAFVDTVYIPAVQSQGGPLPSRREAMPAHHAGAVQR